MRTIRVVRFASPWCNGSTASSNLAGPGSILAGLLSRRGPERFGAPASTGGSRSTSGLPRRRVRPRVRRGHDVPPLAAPSARAAGPAAIADCRGQIALWFELDSPEDAEAELYAPPRAAPSLADPHDPEMLDVAGFDTATPQLVSDFARGAL